MKDFEQITTLGLGPFRFRNIWKWDDDIVLAAKTFTRVWKEVPNIVLIHPKTIRKIHLVCRTILRERGDFSEFEGLGSIEVVGETVHICVSDSVDQDKFTIIYDPTARFGAIDQ